MKFKDVVKHSKTREKAKYDGGIAVLAYHSGTEKGTGDIAEMVHGKSQASLYKLNTPHRVASTRITHTHSDKLSRIKDHAKTAISIHGHGRKNNGRDKTIYVTGQNNYLAKKIASEIEGKLGKKYTIETNVKNTPKHLRGESQYNLVNKFEKKGVQVELPKKLRDSSLHRTYVARSISNVVKKESGKYKPMYEKAA
ncbi:poly-gamma-glutamate hydrolase family protein [Candidatus Woesearchaeota archaeon]|nr:poly-gamma-glutamate hydrolase family protein [Candidatus Woesearchaeota archaeon]